MGDARPTCRDGAEGCDDLHRPTRAGLLLWSMRRWTMGVCGGFSAEAEIRDHLAQVAPDEAADALFGFLWAVGLHASRSLSVACTCQPAPEQDERLLLDVVALYQAGRNLEAMMLLRSILPPEAALTAREPASALALILRSAGHVLRPSQAPVVRQLAGVTDPARVLH